MTDGVQVFDLQGPFALSALQRGAELSVDTASASVARLLFGMNVFLYRHDQHDRFRIHITRGLGEALYQNLCHAMQSAVVHASER